MDSKRPKLCSLETDNADNEVDILQPREVGITTFVQPLVQGFDATLKNRWEDFIVREFRGQNYAKLTDLAPIPDPTPEAYDFNMEKKLEVHLSGLQNLSRGDSEVLKIKAPDYKADRTQIHQAIRALFPSLESTTSKDGNENIIVVHRKDHPEAKGSRHSKRKANGMSKSAPYCHFVLYKEGKDTLSAIQVLSRFLHVGPSIFSFAGTKDRRAITTQFVTAKGINSKTLSLLNARLHGLRLGNFSYVSSPLFLGDLDGNQFVVVLRSVCAPRSVVETSVGTWKNTGFVNYYGLQRFGHSSKSKSFEIGKYLIRSKWADAIDLILKPTYADLPFLRKVKEKFLQSGDAKGCADDCPLGIEKTLLLGIAKYGKTLDAIQMLPRNLRQLYVHSYQSFLWNHVASLRMTRQNPGDFFAKPGDLYYNDQNVITTDNYEDDINFDESVLETDNSSISSANSLPSSKLSFIHPLVVGENEKIPLNSVVLPVPGYAVQYPKNNSADWYTELLKEDCLTVKDFSHSVKDFALPGSYRKLIVVPENVKYEFHEYSNPDIPLVKSDLQLLNGTITSSILTPASQNETQNNDICLDKDGKQQAIVLTFNLPKSSYATMAIRELTKTVIEKK
ncbi:multisubstrate pseudouridine synthase 7, variant 2 [Schistosoma haematobium]|uniref:Multisubstrate pseudouridine synthase 7, variant 2 n=1 Tax=Schistosoma haematobium TaxID=6185 RepID=A0A922IQN0_SCHHA|nr:multisubstrate pseudouridine synthase 7, variant 2 [Schistosoma haematobium]KAH9585054.1 multisubstrate pseudouridine synthase 7, variant 2 [Schistosoma haematobium]CAH8511504.1 unnamed protein product [Schistosoma haematobium]CAH8514574.1 unnamed protein product [Schistosoma haematobium]